MWGIVAPAFPIKRCLRFMCIPWGWAQAACLARGLLASPSRASRALLQLWLSEQGTSRNWKRNEKTSAGVRGQTRKTTKNPKEVKFCKMQILVYPQVYPISSGIWNESCIFSESQFKVKHWRFICQLWYKCCLIAEGKQWQESNFTLQNC